MISEKDKQAILNGAYGISRCGKKCKFVGKAAHPDDYMHKFIYLNDEGLIYTSMYLNNSFENYGGVKSDFDVTGLWEDKVELFNLEKALAGEPVKLRCGLKAYIKYVMPPEYRGKYPLMGYIMNPDIACEVESYSWIREGKALLTVSEHENDIIGMWKEPASSTVTVTLPRALREPRDEMWYFTEYGVFKSSFGTEISKDNFEKSVYFGSEADAKAWFNTMLNSRK